MGVSACRRRYVYQLLGNIYKISDSPFTETGTSIRLSAAFPARVHLSSLQLLVAELGITGESQQMAAAARKGWEQYMLQLQQHPLRTKAIAAGMLAGISDSVAQKLSGVQRIQLRRLLLKMLFGFAYGGPVGHFFHKFMDIIFRGKKDNKTVAKKVLLEQLTSSPCTHFISLVYYGLVVEGRTWQQVRHKVRKEYPSVQLTAWMFRPVVGWINYRYMPLQFRDVFHSFVAFCWGMFLNLRARRLALPK